MSVLLKKKDRNLLLHSEATKVENWLLDFLVSNKKITDKVVNALPEDRKTFFRNMIGRIKQEASKEWVRDSDKDAPEIDLGDDRIPCSLCSTANQLVFFVVNRINGHKMNVGSSCVFSFGGLGISHLGMSAKDLIKNATKLRLESELDKLWPGIASILNSLEFKLTTYSIEIPQVLEDRYMSVGKQLKDLFDGYISERYKKPALDKLPKIKQDYEQILAEIDKHVDSEMKSDNPFVAKKSISNWLRRNDRQGLKWLKEDGGIRQRTAFRICEPSFMYSVVPLLNQELNKKQIVIEKALPDIKGYQFSYKDDPRIKLFISHATLLRDYCGFLTGEEITIPSMMDLLSDTSIYLDNQDSTIYAVQSMNRILRPTPLRIFEHDVAFDELFARQGNTVYQCSLRSILKKFKGQIINIDSPSPTSLADALTDGYSMTVSEYDDFVEARDTFGKRKDRV